VTGSGGLVMMMLMVVAMVTGGECRACKHQQEQGSGKNLFHTKNLT
jgi:hypothetical protein